MSVQTTYEDSRSAISSLESASGPTPCDKRDGLMINQFGQEVAPASLSARQAKALGLLTSGTYGPPSSSSSKSAVLQLSLESRLRAKTQTLGSTLYTLTWKAWVTPSGVSRSRLRASVRRTSETDCIGWPTPTVTDASNRTHCYSAGNKQRPVATLPGACRGLTWNGLSAQTAASGCVNPALSFWLMAIPSIWLNCAPQATRSTPKLRKSSSKV